MTNNFRPNGDATWGQTSATNVAAVTGTNQKTKVTGSAVFISVYAQPIFIGWGQESESVTATTGIYLAAGFTGVFVCPMKAPFFHYLRASGSDGSVSFMFGQNV